MPRTSPKTETFSLPFEQWPKLHQQAWIALFKKKSVFDEIRPSDTWSERTILLYKNNYGFWLKYNVLLGIDINNSSPETLMHQQSVESFIQYIKITSNDQSCYTRLSNLYSVMRVLSPKGDWEWLNNAAKFYRQKAQASKPERGYLPSAADICQLGLFLMERAETDPPRNKKEKTGLSDIKRAALYRDGLMIVLLISRQFRSENFTLLELGHTIQVYETTASLFLNGELTKEGNIIECEFPPSLFGNLLKYLTKYRPILMASGKDDNITALWISNYGGALAVNSLYSVINKHVLKRFGFSVSPHKFRNIAATALIEQDPSSTPLASILLGHKSQTIVEKHYNHANPDLGTARYADQLARFRNQS